MKKLTVLFSIAIALFSCKTSHYVQYTEAHVKLMQQKYLDIPHNDTNIVRGIYFTNPPIKHLLKNKSTMSALVGCYLTGDSLGLPNDVAIILALKKKGGELLYYDLKSLNTSNAAILKTVCPPPYNVVCPSTYLSQ